jgi:hypothetical protein
MINVNSEKVQLEVARIVPERIEPVCPEILNFKVNTVRQQLSGGAYDERRRLDIAFDRLLDELFE